MATTYTFTSDSNTGGSPSYVADRYNITDTSVWTSHCIQTNGSGTHWLKVDFTTPRTIAAFGVGGYPGGSHQPSSTWRLEGSPNDSNWTVVWSGAAANWLADAGGSYPPRITNVVQSIGSYRYYRVIGDSWTNGYMLMCNLAMYE
jgi:hypothetical protein